MASAGPASSPQDPIVVATCCADEGVFYTQAGLWKSYRTVVGYLNAVGLTARTGSSAPSSPKRRAI